MFNDTPSRYGLVSRLLHWITALLVIFQFLRFLGKYVDPTHWINATFKPLHASLGFTLLVVVIIRLVWMFIQYSSRPRPNQFAVVAKTAHNFMYILLVLMPLSGMAYVLSHGRAVTVFGHEVIPAFSGLWLEILGSYHKKFAWILLILVIGHIGAALYHHFIDRDDTLKRML